MQATEYFFTASDGAQVFTRSFEPSPEAGKPGAVVHLVHGMAEHTGRPSLRRLFEALTAQGFAVVTHDQRGHGRTAEKAKEQGGVGIGCVDVAEGAMPRMVKDVAELLAATHKARPECKVILWGHSMGSLISQLCAGAGAGGVSLSGLVLSGPPARLPAFMAGPFGLVTMGLVAASGEHGMSPVPKKLSFDKFNAQVHKACGTTAITGFDWLSRDKEEVQKYTEDPLCGHDMSAGFWRSFKLAMDKFRDPAAVFAALPSDLPVLVLVGEDDFCTVNDLGTRSFTQVAQELRAAGKTTPKVIIYPGARHEVLLETNAEEVIMDGLSFCLRCTGAAPRSKL